MKKTILIFSTLVFISGLFLFVPVKSKAVSYSNGTLIRAQGDPKVFVIHNNKKRWLRNEAIFNSYSFSWEAINVLPPSIVSAIPDINLVSSGDVKVFILNDMGYKRHLINGNVFNSYGFSWGDIAYINQTELDSYPDIKLIKESGDEKVYYLVQGRTKQWVKTAESFKANDFEWETIQTVNQVEMSAYITGENITATEEEIPVTKNVEELLPVNMSDPVVTTLSQKIGESDAEVLTDFLNTRGETLTPQLINSFIKDHTPGYDVDNDTTIMSDPEAPFFLEIVENSLDRLYGFSPDIYQYAISSLRYIRGVNFGTRCGAGRTGYKHLGMEINTYNWIYDYGDTPFDKKPLVSGFLFIHEATHNKTQALKDSGQIRQLTGEENETVAYLVHGYYAKEYDLGEQGILNDGWAMTLKEFVKRWVFKCIEEPEDYVWDWDFYVSVLEKAGFPAKDLVKLKAYLTINSAAPVMSNIQPARTTSNSTDIILTTDKSAKLVKLEYSLNSDLSSAEIITGDGYGMTPLYMITNLSPGKTYYYRITLIDISGNSSVSSIHEFTTLND